MVDTNTAPIEPNLKDSAELKPADQICTTIVNGISLANLDYDGVVQLVCKWGKAYEHKYIGVCNAHSVSMSTWTPLLRHSLTHSSLNTADGMPLVWLQRLLGHKEASRVYGPQLMLEILKKSTSMELRIALYGGHPDRLPKLLDRLNELFPGINIVATVIPPFRPVTEAEDKAYTAELVASQPHITFVGIGCPRQENWMQAHTNRIPGVLIGVGAAFDFHAGAVKQSPPILQKMGMEWAFRLAMEPKRLFMRYLTTNPVIVACGAFQVIAHKLAGKSYIKTRTERPPKSSSRQTETTPVIAICLSTYQRPDLLAELLESIERCNRPENAHLDLRIIDNDEKQTALKTFEAFKKKATGFSHIQYKVEPQQNIAISRNAAINLGPADYYLFVDDDETVNDTWLTSLLQTIIYYQADAVFGPVIGRMREGYNKWMHRGKFFDKSVPATGTVLDWRETRTSNTLVKGEWFNTRRFAFDPALGRSGGSDSDLFARMSKAGAMYYSCLEAVAEEDVPPQRAQLKWLWDRAYRNGLIYERNIRRSGWPNFPMVRATKRLVASCIMMLGATPRYFRGEKEIFYHGLLKIPLMLGGLKATISPSSTTKHVAYTASSQNGRN